MAGTSNQSVPEMAIDYGSNSFKFYDWLWLMVYIYIYTRLFILFISVDHWPLIFTIIYRSYYISYSIHSHYPIGFGSKNIKVYGFARFFPDGSWPFYWRTYRLSTWGMNINQSQLFWRSPTIGFMNNTDIYLYCLSFKYSQSFAVIMCNFDMSH